MTKTEELIAEWKAKGFTEIHLFKGEYTLLVDPKTYNKVRIYDNGDVWVSDPNTGEYKTVRRP